MKVHEVADIIVQPQYGYGDREQEGQKAVIPPNSTLHYTAELVELQKVPLYHESVICGKAADIQLQQ